MDQVQNKKRHIELEVVDSADGFVAFKIKEQTHRGDEFSYYGSMFVSSNEYVLESRNSPMVEECYDRLFVLGSNAEDDNIVLTASLDFFEKIKAAVAEYNEKNGNHLWPYEGRVYYYIESDGCIEAEISGGDYEWDIRRSNFGNVFSTIEEAKAVRARVKKALKGE